MFSFYFYSRYAIIKGVNLWKKISTMAKLKDVAQLAGVSIAAVSLYVNGKSTIDTISNDIKLNGDSTNGWNLEK